MCHYERSSAVRAKSDFNVYIGCAKEQGVCAKCRCRVDQTVGRCVL